MIASRDSGANIVTVQASELSVAACPPLGSGDGIVTAQTSALIGLESASPLQDEMLADDRDGSFASISSTSAYPPIAIAEQTSRDVHFVPVADINLSD
jgi:hypothetical protein